MAVDLFVWFCGTYCGVMQKTIFPKYSLALFNSMVYNSHCTVLKQ